MSQTTEAPQTATIYDLGYKRYAGLRKPQSTRWWVVSRQVVSSAWKTWWQLKLWLGFAVLVTVIVAAIMIVFRSDTFKQLGEIEAVVRTVDKIVFDSIIYFTWIAFLLSLTVGSRVVATDLRSGAFTFYFSRPVRPVDYLIGKWIGLFLVQAVVLLAPLVVLALVRLGVSKNQTELIANLEYLPKAMLIGTLAAATYASVSLAVSSMMASPKVNVAIWAVVYLIGLGIPAGAGAGTKTWDLIAIDFPNGLLALSHHLYNMEGPLKPGVGLPSLEVTLGVLAFYIIGGILFTWWRVRETAYRGIGGT